MKMCLTLRVLVICHLCLYSITGDSRSYPPFEFRSVPTDIRANTLSFPNSNISPHSNHVSRQQIIHTSAMQSQPVPNVEKARTKNSEFSFTDYLPAMNGLPEEHHHNLREKFRDFVDRHNYLSSKDPRQKYDYLTSGPIQESVSTYELSTTEQPLTKISPKFNLIESLTTKMSSKINGLMELVFALLGSRSNNSIMTGLQDVVVNGIVRPLMEASGGVKMLISKMSVPLISLLLVNVEVLVTVWWLWDDWAAQPSQFSFSSPVNSNNSNSTNK